MVKPFELYKSWNALPTISLALADNAICSLWPSGYRSINRAFGPADRVILVHLLLLHSLWILLPCIKVQIL